MIDPYELMKIIPAPIRGPFEPSWDSLKNYRVPTWFTCSKLALFIHWGVYSVPAFGNEWYPRHMYMPDRAEHELHLREFGPLTEFGYKDFIPMFTAEKWDPDGWAKLFKESGVKSVVLVAEHHDGFALWDSSYTRWCAARMGPRRDLVRELKDSVEHQGLIFGLSYHRAEHWWFFEPGKRIDSDVRDPRYLDLYGPAEPASTDPKAPPSPSNVPPDEGFLRDWLLRAVELVEKYRPKLLYFDWWIANPAFQPYLKAFAAYYYNRSESWGEEPVIIYKHEAFPSGTAIPDLAERGSVEEFKPITWLADTSVDYKSWGYIRDAEYKPSNTIIWHMVDVVSKNGVFLLNIGPRSDGTIPEEQKKILLDMGRWLRTSGEAIYGTKPWKTYGEGPTYFRKGGFFTEKELKFTRGDVRYTVREAYPLGKLIYAVTPMSSNQPEIVNLKSLGRGLRLLDESEEIVDVDILGSDEKPSWRCEDEGLIVNVPTDMPSMDLLAIRIIVRKSR